MKMMNCTTVQTMNVKHQLCPTDNFDPLYTISINLLVAIFVYFLLIFNMTLQTNFSPDIIN